jgi:putative permease
MMHLLRSWYERHFTNPESIILLLLLAIGAAFIITMSKILAPVIAAIVIAFVLEWLIKSVMRFKIPRTPAFYLVFLIFIGILLFLVLALAPLLWHQATLMFEEIPRMMVLGQERLMSLPKDYPDYFAASAIDDLVVSLKGQTSTVGRLLLSYSLASIPTLLTLMVYLVIVPLMVFFFLKDRDQIVGWFSELLPQQRGLAVRVWKEVHDQLGNFILGKVGQIFIVGIVSIIVFKVLHLKYAILLGSIVGVSVLVPYIGAISAAVPLIIMSWYQFGLSPQFIYVGFAYAIIQALDGNVLTPLLFSGVVNIHPIAIIVAILFFGGIWGFWGVFFAIPLAILIKAVINAWP